MTDLTVGVVGMKGAMEGLARALQCEVDDLKTQLDRQRRLTKYARRTWFEVMAYIFMVGLLIADVGRRYCGADGDQVGQTAGAVCNVVFWTTEHGGGVQWRITGMVATAGLLFWLGRRAQVPDDLFDDVPHAQIRRERPHWWSRRN